jgi:mycothiol synthase
MHCFHARPRLEVKLMDGLLTRSAFSPDHATAVAKLINCAYNDWRALERVNAFVPADPPPVAADELVAAIEHGELDPDASLVLWQAEEPAGVVTVGFAAASDEARLGWLAVRPDMRRRGIGRQLLQHALAQSRRYACRRLVTMSPVDSRFLPAVRLLETAGFAWVDRQRCNVTLRMDIRAWQPVEPHLPSGFAIRSWQDGDEPVWTAVKRAAFDDNTPIGFWRSTFGSRHDFDPNGWLFCFHHDKPVGICAAVVTRYPQSNQVMGCSIEWVGVLPEYRGLGLGRALMTAALNYAYPLQPSPLVLVTQPFRVAAVRLYESLGFRKVKEWRTYQIDL